MEIVQEYAERYLPTLQDESVDLIVIDPPYGMIQNAQNWDELPDWKFLRQEFERILNPIGQFMFSGSSR